MYLNTGYIFYHVVFTQIKYIYIVRKGQLEKTSWNTRSSSMKHHCHRSSSSILLRFHFRFCRTTIFKHWSSIGQMISTLWFKWSTPSRHVVVTPEFVNHIFALVENVLTFILEVPDNASKQSFRHSFMN